MLPDVFSSIMDNRALTTDICACTTDIHAVTTDICTCTTDIHAVTTDIGLMSKNWTKIYHVLA